MADLTIAKSSLEAYVIDSNDALDIKLVRQSTDVEDEASSFHSEMSHQVFGDSESIFGYRDLQIQLYYTAARLTAYLGMTFTEKVDPLKHDGVQADEVLKKVAEKLQPGFYTNIDDFVAAIPKDATFKPYGKLLHSLTVEPRDGESEPRMFVIYKCDVTAAGFQDYHERLQTFILWYIDAASFIDIDDDRWKFYLTFEKYKSNGNPMYAVAGYTTVYQYYAYPNKIRPRISQMLVLPPFQNKGLGGEMLNAIYRDFIMDSAVLDVTVEDPSDNFIRLRDYIDARNCIKLASFQPAKLRQGFSGEMAREVREKFKINKRQARRIYEILRLHVTNLQDKHDYKNYRLDVKKRLNIPYYKQNGDVRKLQKVLNADEFQAAMSCTSREQRLENLEKEYRDLEVQYRHTLEKLAASCLT